MAEQDSRGSYSPTEVRDRFLKQFLGPGGSDPSYSKPTSTRLSGGAEIRNQCGFDLDLPARYIAANKCALVVQVAGQKPVSVDFRVRGEVILTASNTTGVADVQVTGLLLESVERCPLARVGDDSGRIRAFLKRVKVGQLDLETGQLMQSDATPITLVLEDGSEPITLKAKTNGSNVRELSEGDENKCLNGNDVDVAVAPQPGGGSNQGADHVTGIVLMGLTPLPLP